MSTYVLIAIRVDSWDDDELESLQQFGDAGVQVRRGLDKQMVRKVKQS